MLRAVTRRGSVRGTRALAYKPDDSLLQFHQGVASLMNGAARALGVQHRLRIEADSAAPSAAPAVFVVPAPPPKPAASRLNGALRYMTAADISAYTEELVRSGRLELEGVPPQLRGVERFVYAHCVKILLCLMHDSLDCLATGDECNGTVFGLGVVLEQTARNNVDLLGSLRERLRGEKSDIRIDTASVADFIDAIVQVENEARYGNGSATSSSFTASVERLLYKNVSNIVLNLIADACATFRFDIFGHSISLKLAPDKALSLSKMSLDDVRKRRRTLATRPRIFDEELINALTDEILSDKDINMWFVPDELEMSFYRRFFTFYGVVLDYVLSDIRLASLDVDATISLHRVASLSASRAASRAKNKT